MLGTVVGAGNTDRKQRDAAPVIVELICVMGDLAGNHQVPWNVVLCMSRFFCFLQSKFRAI